MPNNPVQIILNDEAFLRSPDPKRGGIDKDFFERRDGAFVNHRTNLLTKIDEIENEVKRSAFGPLCYLKVSMRVEAIAKSYRPNRAIFQVDQFPCVGAGAPGELYFRAPLIYLPRLRKHIESAEDQGETRFSGVTEKSYHFVTRARCEVGAIETIELAPSNLKRNFSADAAVAALTDSRAASGYIIELFETQPLLAGGDQDVLGLRRLMTTFQTILRESGSGLLATVLPGLGGMPAIEVTLSNSAELPRLEDRRVINVGQREILPYLQVDRNVQRHDTLLRRLAEHPLVRRIRFPILIEPTMVDSTEGTSPFPLVNRVSDGQYPKIGVIDTGISGPLENWVVGRHDFLDATNCDTDHGTMVAGVLIGARCPSSDKYGLFAA
ncbi:MAG: hypothetical protein ABIN69_01100 [Aestuariivirga sp.]